MRRFEGRAAIVTGASDGIGAETARRLAAEGAALLLVGRRPAAKAAVLPELDPARTRYLALDLNDDGSPEAVVTAALAAFGRLDVLVNNAGEDYTRPLLDAPIADVRRVFETNFFAAFRMLQAAAREMKSHGGGAIVNVTSRLAVIGVDTMAVYGSSKGALLTLTRGAAIELAAAGIRVNAVAPGLTATPLYLAYLERQADPRGTEAAARSAIPQGRVAEPADVAAAIAYLASDDAAHVTGHSLAVDGGYTAA
jgi:NAD(P)-dependent dehydrogenase (short-subunit alcohol dehydrogenase family)